jgi:tRNA threonylcarbamoyladenosine biosynthesis protein TsaB
VTTTLLALDTSITRGSVALLSSGAVTSRSYDGAGDHAERILDEASKLLADQGLTPRDIRAIAICVGPGSFTGVRVGVATAKAIALATGAPLVTASSLELLAASYEGAEPGPRVAILDARRGEVFVGVYTREGQPLLADQHLAVSALGPLVASLPGAPVLLGWWPEGAELGAARRSEPSEVPSAEILARVGLARLERGEVASTADLEPLYLRPPDATLPSSSAAKSV